MTDALLYVLNYQSRADDIKKINFLRCKARAKRLMRYILDARHTSELKLYDFDDHLLDHNTKEIEEKRVESFYKSRVKPKEFLVWLNSLSLDLPVVQQYFERETSSKIEVNPLPQELGFEKLLHPIIVQSSYRHYRDGHLRDAVLNSVVAVFDFIRKKTGLTLDGENLVSRAFSLSDPYIILSDLTSESGKSDQKGFIEIFKGAYQGIRNPKAHSLEHDLTPEKAAQYLIFASLLARRVEEAKFPKAEN